MAQAKESMTVDLDMPFLVRGEPVSVLEFKRRPTAGDLEWCEDAGYTGTKAGIQLVARLTLVPTDDLRRMDAADWQRVDAKLARFLRPGPSIGSEQSPSSRGPSVSPEQSVPI